MPPPPKATVGAASDGDTLTSEMIALSMSRDPNSTPYSLDLHNRGLRYLDVSALSDYPRLRSLDVSFNSLASLLELSALGELRELKAYDNQLEDVESLPTTCPHLVSLDIRSNTLGPSLPKSFRTLSHLQTLNVSNNSLTSLSNLTSSTTTLTHLDCSSNQLTNAHLSSLNLLINLQTLDLSQNDLGPPLPPALSQLTNLTDLTLSDNHLTSLSSLPSNLVSLTASRNHMSTLTLPRLPRLQDLTIPSNRLTSLPPLQPLIPSLDTLDISLNRIPSTSHFTASLSPLASLKEVTVSGNPCTPTDMNGNVFGDEAMAWWYEIVSVGGLEVCDGLVADSEDVLGTVKRLGREKEVGERRARPKSARRKGGATAGSKVPLFRPPMAHEGAAGAAFKLEPMDDIETKFKTIRERLDRCKALTRREGGRDGGGAEVSPQTAQKAAQKEGRAEAKALTGRQPSPPPEAKVRGARGIKNAARALSYSKSSPDDVDYEDNESKEEEKGLDDIQALTPTPMVGAGKQRKTRRTSSTIQSMLKKADQRIKRAQAYSGSSKSHLMPVKGREEEKGESEEKVDRSSADLSEALGMKADVGNDAREFHPEFEQYEGATLDDYDMGFGFGRAQGKEARGAPPKKAFNLDDFDEDSSEDEFWTGKVGVAPDAGIGARRRFPTPDTPEGEEKGDDDEDDGTGDEGHYSESLVEGDQRGGSGGSLGLSKINPFTGKVMEFKEEEKEADMGAEDMREEQELVDGITSATGVSGSPRTSATSSSLKKIPLSLDKVKPIDMPLISPRFDSTTHSVASRSRMPPTKAERKGSYGHKGFRIPGGRRPQGQQG